MLKTLMVLAVLAVAGCTNQGKPLPTVKADDPVLPLNSGLWNGDTNTLVTPPADNGRLPHG